MKGGNQDKKINPIGQIKKIEQKRQERRLKMQQAKRQKEQKRAYNLASGKNVDIDFEIMIDKNRFKQKILSQHTSIADMKLAVCVRKRPIFKKEQQNGQIDSVSCANPQIKIHQPKYKVDGITKFVQNHIFTFDNTFNELEQTHAIYQCALKPLIPLLIHNGIVTCFAYGQTGSGKTFTMNEIQKKTVEELYFLCKKDFEISICYYEIYAGRCLDLLNDKNVLNILEDKNNNIQIQGLTQKYAYSAKQLMEIMQIANSVRTTHATVANDTSSRSHAICQILIKKGDNQIGKLILVDLAGSQRAQDTQSNNRQRRMQGAEINKSLLALKQCIRAMDQKADHVPFRASKLTLVLRDSFIAKQDKSKVLMIACISPGSSSADHSLNTLRYADRLKDNSQAHKMYNQMNQINRKNQFQIQNQFSKEHIQKIESLKNISKKQQNKQSQNPNQPPIINNNNNHNNNNNNNNHNNNNNNNNHNNNNNNHNNKHILPEKKSSPPPPIILNNNNNSGIGSKQIKKQEIKDDKQKKNQNRSNSIKRNINGTNLPINNSNGKTNQNNQSGNAKRSNNQKINKSNEIKQYDDLIQQEIDEQKNNKNYKNQQKKARDDMNVMKETLKGNNKQQYFAFQQKVTNILQQQQQVFATHMAAIKQDAKLLTQESQLISKVQGVGFIDYDIDSYVDKLQNVIKKKLRMYNLLSKKVQNFKKYLSQEEEIRHKVKQTFYF